VDPLDTGNVDVDPVDDTASAEDNAFAVRVY
jgi:hypothetical protein